LAALVVETTDAAQRGHLTRKDGTMQKLTPCLWFDTEGEDAARFYAAAEV
jgi:hypothetical protein